MVQKGVANLKRKGLIITGKEESWKFPWKKVIPQLGRKIGKGRN